MDIHINVRVIIMAMVPITVMMPPVMVPSITIYKNTAS
jgi:hypothetical protein